MDRQKIERSIKGLSEWQMHVQAESDIDTNISTAIEALKAQLSQEGTTSDTISRQAALEKVRAMQTYKLFMGDDMILVDKAEVQTELMMLPPAQPEPQWIPVSERLPEKGGEYLVSVHHTIGAISVFHPEKDTYVDDVAIMKYYGKFPSTVRAWMPLPEAYTK